MKDKKAYINEETDVADYSDNYAVAEDMLEHVGVFPADSDEVEISSKLDADFIKTRRRENAKILLDAFGDIAIFPEFKDDDCPLFVPVKVKKRNELRAHLTQKEIFCPFHWPKSSYHTEVSPETEEVYNCEVSLVCDQRYDETHMKRIVKEIRSFARL